MTQQNPWKTLSTRMIYENPWISVREDQVIRPNGTPGIYGVVEARLATGVVALTEENEVYLVGQYRYPTNVYSWEIIEGGADTGEDALTAITRELKEEAGLTAAHWEELGGEFHLSNCFSAERGRLFLARRLTDGESAPDDTEQLQVKKVPFAEALRMVDSGEIVDAVSIIGILRAQRHLGL